MKYGIFEPKSWWKYDIYWLLESSFFNLFRNGKYGLLEPKSWLKDDIYWLMKTSCFELSGDGKYGLFLSQEVVGKIIFTSYWEVLALNFLVMGNTVFFTAKKLMERLYLHDFFEFSMIFEDLGNMVFQAVLSFWLLVKELATYHVYS